MKSRRAKPNPHTRTITVLLFLILSVSGCATTRPPLEFSIRTIQQTSPYISVEPAAQVIGKSVFATQLYVLNNTPHSLQLLLDNILLLDENSVVLKKLTPAEVANLMMIDLGYNEFADPNKFRAAAETASLKDSYIIPGTAVKGKVFWFRNFQRFPIFLHIGIGEEVFRFQIDIKGTSDGKGDHPSDRVRRS